jgi:hypothetical protein
METTPVPEGDDFEINSSATRDIADPRAEGDRRSLDHFKERG